MTLPKRNDVSTLRYVQLRERVGEERKMATSNNPRKFSEKIALHNQKQAEETAAFEEVMKDLSITRAARLQLQKTQYLQLGQNRGQFYGGSLPNVNQIGNSTIDLPFQTPFQTSGLDTSRTTRHHGLVDRVYRDRNRITSPHRRPLSVDKHEEEFSLNTYDVLSLKNTKHQGQRKGKSLIKCFNIQGLDDSPTGDEQDC
ncbi:hypothetical protein SKAU_G00053170 [Synaphobranchus kaupii]|uniref:Transducer of regulated CREB activity N-terminal domain-containing protein n=1 Tax=Synaphobranchus kaupii TaxID=118154 RepID=A0A9Q1G3F4_SYNKA|nr:hypothetical protein SKAU_G00053170 [Synaphobranchus kaupii]